jgi:2-methylcitrate dehydratase PrpD
MTVLETLAGFVAGFSLDDLPGAAVTAARRAILDTFGVTLAGSQSAPAVAARNAYSGRLRSGPAVVFKAGHAETEVAALLNGIAAQTPALAHLHSAAELRPGAIIVPVAFAMCEDETVGGARLLSSVVAGYEVAIRLALGANATLRERGVDPVGYCGLIGAAAAAARAQRLGAQRAAQALALAVLRAPSLSATGSDDEWLDRLEAGTAAAGGAAAARLAAAGYQGPAVQHSPSAAWLDEPKVGEVVLADLGERFHLTDLRFVVGEGAALSDSASLDDQELEAKFSQLAAPLVGGDASARDLISLVWGLSHEPALAMLAVRLGPRAAG